MCTSAYMYEQGYDGFIEKLTAYLPLMDNSHLVLLMRNFVEQYVLNALPMFYPQVRIFVMGFMMFFALVVV